MPSGVYPEFKDKKGTIPHPASGLSKNAYLSDGTKRPARKSRAKITAVKEEIGLDVTKDLTHSFNQRILQFQALSKIVNDPTINEFIKYPALMATREAQDILDSFKEELSETKLEDSDPFYNKKGRIADMVAKREPQYERGERSKFSTSDKEVASDTPLLMRDTIRKAYPREPKSADAKGSAGGRLTHIGDLDMNVGTYEAVNQQQDPKTDRLKQAKDFYQKTF